MNALQDDPTVNCGRTVTSLNGVITGSRGRSEVVNI